MSSHATTGPMSYQRNAIDSVKRGSDKKSLKDRARQFASEAVSPAASAQPMRLSRHELALALDRREQYQRLKVHVDSSGNLDTGVKMNMNEESNALMHLGSEDQRVETPSQDVVAASDGEATPAPVINIQTSNQSQPDLQR